MGCNSFANAEKTDGQELHGTVIEFHLCHKSVCKISVLVDLHQSTAIIVKWKHLVSTIAQPSCKLTEWGFQVLKCTARKHCPSSVASLTTEFQTASGSNINTKTVHWDLKWVSMVKQLHIRPKSLSTMPGISWSGVKHALQSDESCFPT